MQSSFLIAELDSSFYRVVAGMHPIPQLLGQGQRQRSYTMGQQIHQTVSGDNTDVIQ